MISAEMLAVTYGLGSAVAWGAGDFSGGFASRKGNVVGVILASQFIGGIILTVMAMLSSEIIPPVKYFCHGALAGIFGAFGMIMLYRGLAKGRMGIVAPMSAVLTALVPIGYAAFFQGLPTATQFLGFLCVMIAVWLLSSSSDSSFKMTWEEFYLSTLAGLGFGFFFIFIDKANDLAVIWPLVGARAASVSLLFCLAYAGRQPLIPIRSQWIFIVITGVLDAVGNALFSMAAHLGRLDVSAVLGALYPASTVMLAWIILKERLGKQQWAGVLTAFAALVLISA
ncbi:conserved membrane hypothetical protein [Desulfamplus magnetovallimortis]|uniref:EamA domain-containing protein n=1 Tax=Desulfamplus magnetovallimortis TaxID=1246637 RepID=A0A1W1HBJ8_9BACT|nr:EamA family transporter [Desulfamplus magnetovallimortis]SLM29765.1 conserved membrane hypothetical protein [Desulfamplus magnetovallimortis]